MEHNILIIGAGPAALYAAQKLAKEGANCVIVNRDIKHGGLAEFGIYPNKYKMKSGLRKMFHMILTDDRIRYFGNVTVGLSGDITLEELKALGFDAVVVAVGAQGTKWLGLPGEEHGSVFHAKDLVYHYNGLPPFSEREFAIGNDVVVVGMGNVCLDIVHWLVCEKKVNRVTAVARRGPAERKYTEKEMKLVSGALDVETVSSDLLSNRSTMEAVDQEPDALLEEIIAHRDVELETESPTQFSIKFFRSPSSLEGDAEGRVNSVVCDVTKLVPKDDGSLGARSTGDTETIPCDTVIFAIGDSIENAIGLPLSADGSTFGTVDETWKEDAPRYTVADPESGDVWSDTFVVGWARRASEGLVGKARQDAVKGCEEVLAYLDGEFGEVKHHGTEFESLVASVTDAFAERKIDFVTYDDVQKLVAAEQAIAESSGLQEFKLHTTDEMFSYIRGER